ncbi:hypothetical protein K432DRAFT_407265 [Lepidopterella palustris CBS 459.81]|uniref:Uncharacterized protein n=1 Tax=Lepidopterella palustris CBS 459.81 TaxID=1314670 RepID=A0A8E2E5C9_9PEZI|nr:hypothetical protein K432DRAFT_407265 [Lepidopterella palustris CBS 459.81]
MKTAPSTRRIKYNYRHRILPAIKPAASEPAAPKPTAPKPTAIEPAAVEPMGIEPAAAELVAAEPIAAEPVVAEPAARNLAPKATEISADLNKNNIFPEGTRRQRRAAHETALANTNKLSGFHAAFLIGLVKENWLAPTALHQDRLLEQPKNWK